MPARAGSVALAIPLYTAGIAAAEGLAVAGAFTAAILVHVLVVLAAANHYLLAAARGQQGPAEALLVLPLVSVLRIVSLTVAQDEVPRVPAYAVAGLPLLLSVAAATWFLRPRRISPLRPRSWLDIPLALAGVPLGYAAYRLAEPAPLYADPTTRRLVIAGLAVFVSTGVVEELVFRGVLLEALTRVYGRFGVLWSTLLYGLAYLGVRPVSYAATVVALGLVFAWHVDRTGSVAGVAVAHGLLNVGLIVVWPWLLA